MAPLKALHNLSRTKSKDLSDTAYLPVKRKYGSSSHPALNAILQKYSFVCSRKSLFLQFCHDFYHALGAQKALFFLANELPEHQYSIKLYPPTADEQVGPILFSDQSAYARVILRNDGRLIQLQEPEKTDFVQLLHDSGFAVRAEEALFALPVIHNRRLAGLFLLINPGYLNSPSALENEQIHQLARIARQIALNEIQEIQHRQEAFERDILLKLAQRISSSLRLERVLENIIDSLKLVVPYDSAAIFLLNHKTREIEYEIARGYSEEARKLLRMKVGQGLSGWVAQKGRPVIVPDVTKDPRYIKADPQTRSELAVPIRSGGKILGVFNLESHKLNAFTPHQAELLEAFAGSAAIAIQNARLYKMVVEKRELEKDLLVARKIQLALLPHKMPRAGRIVLSAYSLPSRQVGGDLYDAVKLADGNIAIAVADVSGKGVPGALLMASLHTIYRAEIRRGLSAARLMTRVNRHFCESASDGNFATFFHAIIHPKERQIEYCNAGHNAAILVRHDGSVEQLESTGIILGFMREAKYQDVQVNFEPGDVLVAYSDGITEAENAHEEMFGKDRLISVVQELRPMTPAKIKKGIIEALRDFTHFGKIQDDVTLLVVKYMEK